MRSTLFCEPTRPGSSLSLQQQSVMFPEATSSRVPTCRTLPILHRVQLAALRFQETESLSCSTRDSKNIHTVDAGFFSHGGSVALDQNSHRRLFDRI
jgi:hypothetical protein